MCENNDHPWPGGSKRTGQKKLIRLCRQILTLRTLNKKKTFYF